MCSHIIIITYIGTISPARYCYKWCAARSLFLAPRTPDDDTDDTDSAYHGRVHNFNNSNNYKIFIPRPLPYYDVFV